MKGLNFSIDVNFGMDVVLFELYTVIDSDPILSTWDELVRFKEEDYGILDFSSFLLVDFALFSLIT